MKIIHKKLAEGTWVQYDADKSVELKIRPLSIYDFDRLPSEEHEITVKEFSAFMTKLLVDWKGILDEKKKPLKCDDENKKLLSDHDQDLSVFVINKATELKAKVITDEEVKN